MMKTEIIKNLALGLKKDAKYITDSKEGKKGEMKFSEEFQNIEN